MTRLLLTDYGGVLSDHHQEPAESTLANLLGVSIVDCRKLLSEKSVQGCAVREHRVSENEFWHSVMSLAGCPENETRLQPEKLTRLWAETYRLNRNVLGLFTEVRSATPIGVLTNIDLGRSRYLTKVVGINSLVDLFLPSYKFGAIKPKAKLWICATEQAHIRFGDVEITYVDDRGEHVAACQTYGWIGVQFVNIDQLRDELIERGFLSKSRAVKVGGPIP